MASKDYHTIARAIDYIRQHVDQQPSLQQIADSVQLSPAHFQRLFSRWVGLSPKRFLQVLTLEQAKQHLAADPVMAASEATGLSSASRLHDHFVTLQAVTPAEYRSGGEGLLLSYGFHATPFGDVFIATSYRGVCALHFLDSDLSAAQAMNHFSQQWPKAELVEQSAQTAAFVKQIFEPGNKADKPPSLWVKGTNFQINVWKALLAIPPGAIRSYSQIADGIGRPTAVRAVATAIGANPVAYLIPCHRVIRQSGELGGYRWGLTRKHSILVREQIIDQAEAE